MGDKNMDVNLRLKTLMQEQGWSEYRLAKEANLSQSTIANIFRRNTVPSIATLDAICHSLGLTLSQFFSCNETKDDDNTLRLLRAWTRLSEDQKELLLTLLTHIK